jgi:hypothetical protein
LEAEAEAAHTTEAVIVTVVSVVVVAEQCITEVLILIDPVQVILETVAGKV